ncbi:hypothetical protein ABVT39_024822 [Epinephelus coioides]
MEAEKQTEVKDMDKKKKQTVTQTDGGEEGKAETGELKQRDDSQSAHVCTNPPRLPPILHPPPLLPPIPSLPPFCRPPLSDAVPTPRGFSLTSTIQRANAPLLLRRNQPPRQKIINPK